jgi:hypothetical protein
VTDDSFIRDELTAKRQQRDAERQQREMTRAQDAIDDASVTVARCQRQATGARRIAFALVAASLANQLYGGPLAWVWSVGAWITILCLFIAAGSAITERNKADDAKRTAERKLRNASMGWWDL